MSNDGSFSAFERAGALATRETLCEICERPTYRRDGICLDCWRDHKEDVAEEERHRKALAVVEEVRALANDLSAEYPGPLGHCEGFWRTVVACSGCHTTASMLPTDPFFQSFGVCCENA